MRAPGPARVKTLPYRMMMGGERMKKREERESSCVVSLVKKARNLSDITS